MVKQDDVIELLNKHDLEGVGWYYLDNHPHHYQSIVELLLSNFELISDEVDLANFLFGYWLENDHLKMEGDYVSFLNFSRELLSN